VATLRDLARDLLPPAALRLARRAGVLPGSRSVFEGRYASWAEARAASGGYDAAGVLERVRQAALMVKSGQALYERDSVCFHEPAFRWPVLACLLDGAARRGGRLHVVDFGGSLGSLYFQHRPFLSRLEEVHWSVVEQPHFVAVGRSDLQNEVLTFHETVDECLAARPADLILLSSVLPYLEDPYAVFADLARRGVPSLLLDRTGFVDGPSDRLTVQHVPKALYEASYPAWFLSSSRFDAAVLASGYRRVAAFPCDDDAGIGRYGGMLLERS
jgi:putative methyltransferase (TIGR04325 family)